MGYTQWGQEWAAIAQKNGVAVLFTSEEMQPGCVGTNTDLTSEERNNLSWSNYNLS